MSEPIVVNSNPAPDAIWAAARQILLVIGGWAVGRGYLEDDTLSGIVTVVVIVGPLIYGQIKGLRNHAKLVTAAEAAPSSVANVK